MLKDGKQQIVRSSVGLSKSKLAVVVISVSNNYKPEQCDRVGKLGNRFCHANKGTIYHIDDNLFIVLVDIFSSDELDDFEVSLCKYVIARMRYTKDGRKANGIDIESSTTFVSSGERFGSFIDRAIKPLRPDWFAETQSKGIDRFLYDCVIEKQNFPENSKEIFRTSMEVWTPNAAIHCVKKLLKRGASFDFVDADGNDVIMKCAELGHVQVVGHFDVLDNLFRNYMHRVSPNRQNNLGHTLLMICLMSKTPTDIVNILLTCSNGLNLRLRDEKKRDALTHALNMDNIPVKAKILELGVDDITKDVLGACKIDDVKTMCGPYESGLEIEARLDTFGATAGCCGTISFSHEVEDIFEGDPYVT